MPMKPARPDSTAPTAKTTGGSPVERHAEHHEQHHADEADGGVLPVQVRLRAGLDGGGNLLHARVAGWLRHDPAHGHEAVDDGQHARADRRATEQDQSSWIPL